MNAINAVVEDTAEVSSNVVAVDFTPTSVVSVLTEALTPKSAFALQLAEQAAAKVAAEKKQGGIKDLAEGRQDVFRLNPLVISIDPEWNSRDFTNPENIAHVEMLAVSIAHDGVKEPLTVMWREGKPVLLNGECRLRAVLHAINFLGAEITTVPVKTEDRSANCVDLLVNQRLRNAGKPFTCLEDATHFARLNKLGLTPTEIAKRFGISAPRVGQLLDLHAGATKEIRDLIVTGKVSADLARTVIKEEGEHALEALTEAVEVAEANGKTKATPKHVRAARTGAEASKTRFNRLEVVAILKATRVASNETEDTVALTMTTQEYNRLVEMIG